jgi:hypothetical protein
VIPFCGQGPKRLLSRWQMAYGGAGTPALGRTPSLEARPAYLPTCDVRSRDLQQRLYVDTCHPLCANSRHLVTRPECRIMVITESVAIVLYLAERDPQRRFLPRHIALRAQVYRWLLFAATELEQLLWRIARHIALYPQEMRLPAEPPPARQDFAEMAAVLERHMKDR